MSNRDLRQHMAEFYSDKSMSPEAVDRLVSLAEASRGDRTGRLVHRGPARLLYGVVGVAAGVAMTLLAVPLFNSQSGASSNPTAENDPIVRPMLVEGPSNSVVQPVRAVAGGCKGCEKVVTTGEGFCCGKGRCFGVPMTSKKLHAALVGHKIDASTASTSPCRDCLKSLKSYGKCDHRSLVIGKEYGSPVSYRLAKGTPAAEEFVAPSSTPCKGCKIAFAEDGRCDSCNVGFVAGRMYEQEEDHRAALHAYKTLAKAAKVATKCEGCAIAIVTDGRCAGCNVSFKDGIQVAQDG